MTKTKSRSKGPKQHSFSNKLLLNQWLISLFGVDPIVEHTRDGKKIRPFHVLSNPIRDARMEGLDTDNVHKFFHNLTNSDIFWDDSGRSLTKEQLRTYDENIVRHTLAINERRQRPIVWKYYQWLTLVFVEIYLDRFFDNRTRLLDDLNAYVDRFNRHWEDREYEKLATWDKSDRAKRNPRPFFEADDLNKICLQNATGSGKTLMMHVNLLQYRDYAKKHGKENQLSSTILLTPNERLSEQHIAEFMESGISAVSYFSRSQLFGISRERSVVDVLEITKLADQQGPNTVATRNLGDQNLLLVDEGHRGMSGKDEGAWFSRRSSLCAKGFTFEYSATFEQAVRASGNADFENSYAKTVLFDYSYRWFYEDGFGKDYKIDNLPHPSPDVIRRLVEKGNIKQAARLDHDRDIAQAMQPYFLTACLLKFYQQLRIYQDQTRLFDRFNLVKPLWVFVGSTVSKAKGGSSDEKIVAADVAQIIQFVAEFLDDQKAAAARIQEILSGNGQDTGLLDKNGNDIFANAFLYLAQKRNQNESVDSIYQDILARLFNHRAGGSLVLSRIRGESGEVALRVGTAETPFGLINVGDAKGLCDHVAEVASQNGTRLQIEDSDFGGAMFASVKDSTSPVNLLIGSKKFVEGWDCWRVSTMGLMHVGRSEGTQIIQLFGRGVRLKGYEWSLKRSGHVHVATRPAFIEELETLNVFGIEADFMEKFREFLKQEGLPGNERRITIPIPLNVTYDFGKRLKILCPKKKKSDGSEYDFKKDGPIPSVGDVPDYLKQNPIVSDWYPRIQTMHSKGTSTESEKDNVHLLEMHVALLNLDALFFELEQFKRDRGWHNLNISKDGIRQLLGRSDWYTLYLPQARLNPASFDGVMLLQQIASSLLKHYLDHYYNYCNREYIEPRMELRELTPEDRILPDDDNYHLIVDGDEETLIRAIEQIKKDLEEGKDDLLKEGDLHACNFARHLFQPLFHVRAGKITVLPVVLNKSEYQFVKDLKAWYDRNRSSLEADQKEIYLLRNRSRGKGVGFFEAGNFHPDFILWMLTEDWQYVTFIEPHGLIHEGPASEKVQFYKRIKDVEARLNDPTIELNSFILSCTEYKNLQWGPTQEELEQQHVLFMEDDREHYLEKLFAHIEPKESL